MTESELRDLVERHHRIASLAATPDFQLLADYITAETASKQRWLLGGYADSLERYQHEAGWIKGAMFFLEAPQRLEQQIAREHQRVKEQTQAEEAA